ncbi:MAG TPA: amidohydrolase family protein [Stellaceae bacterium]|jgi:predicted TIM-barrel fold metal-dependent hydrolase|nr:amidohydrolase family protein [Stellaceae bacterium]
MTRIDVHHHLVSPKSIPILRELGTLTPTLAAGMDAHRALEAMDKGGVSTAINSATTPVTLPRDQRVAYARDNNDYLARLVADHPGRFGMFANLPLPHIDATLKEIEYALDVLQADGVHMITSYDDQWLGNKLFAPVFDELNRRKAVVYTHPHTPLCCLKTLTEAAVPDAAIEYGTDTTRAIANYVFSGTSQRCPDLKLIWSHAGGTMPFLIYRFLKTADIPANRQHVPQGIIAELKKYYYDTAQASHAVMLTALREVVGLEHAAFGSDYPWGFSEANLRELDAAGVLSDAERRGINYANILPLLPRMAKTAA